MTISTQFIPTSSGPTNLVSNTLRTVGKLAVVSMVLPCALVFAQSADNIYPAAPTSGGIVGLGVASLPKYQGSDQTQIKGVPILEYHWANGIFVGGENDTLVGFQCTTPSNVQYGTALGVDEGRKERHASALAGMGNVSTKAVLVSFVKAAITDQFSLNASVHIGSGNDNKGALLKLGAAYAIPLGSSAQLSFNAGATLANDSYMENYFGVSAFQASTSQYHVYNPSSGLRDVSVGVRFSYRIDQDWSVLAGISSASLASAAKDSPVVRQTNTQKVFLGLAYSIK